MASIDRPEVSELVARAREIAGVARERSRAAEAARRVGDDMIARMRQADLFRIMQPQAYGGFEYGFDVMVQVEATIASGCGSTGWVYGLLASQQWLIGCLSKQAQDEIWSDRSALSAGTYTPIAQAVARIGVEIGLDIVEVHDGAPEPAAGDLGLLVATHGRDELALLRRALESGVPYVGLVASRPRGTGVRAELRSDGVSDELLDRIDVPAGIDIGARTPGEVAVSILARLVAARRAGGGAHEPSHRPGSAAPLVAIDPICGMSVAAVAGTLSLEHEGETIYFCCDGCLHQFEARLEQASGRA